MIRLGRFFLALPWLIASDTTRVAGEWIAGVRFSPRA